MNKQLILICILIVMTFYDFSLHMIDVLNLNLRDSSYYNYFGLANKIDYNTLWSFYWGSAFIISISILFLELKFKKSKELNIN